MLVTKINLNLSKMQIIHSMDLENWGKKIQILIMKIPS